MQRKQEKSEKDGGIRAKKVEWVNQSRVVEEVESSVLQQSILFYVVGVLKVWIELHDRGVNSSEEWIDRSCLTHISRLHSILVP